MTPKILVADDSITIQKIVAMAFENEEAEVVGIGNGKEAWKQMLDLRPDLVLADVDMPGMNGFELCRRIKQADALRHIRVLVLASDFEDFDFDEYRRCGADDHISKPFKSDDIVEKVRALLEGPAEVPFDGELPEIEPLEEEEDAVIPLSETEMVTPAEEEEEIGEESIELSEQDLLEESAAEPEPQPPRAPENQTAEPEEDFSEPVTLSEEEGEELESAAADADEEFFQKENLQEDQSLDDLLDSVEKNLDESPPEQKTSPSGEAEPDANTSALIDEMLQDVRCLKEETEAEIQKISGKLRKSSRDSGELADVDPASVEDDGQLEKTFQQLRRGKPGPSGEARRKGPGALAAMNEIVPEPEDLLGHLIHPEWASEEKRVIEPRKVSESRPDLIGESLNYLSDLSSRLKEKEARAAHDDEDLKEFADHLNLDSEKFSRWVEGRIRQVVGESLEAVLAKEVAGVSDRISRSIRQAVRETAPGIIRKIIQEEIEKIKRMEEV